MISEAISENVAPQKFGLRIRTVKNRGQRARDFNTSFFCYSREPFVRLQLMHLDFHFHAITEIDFAFLRIYENQLRISYRDVLLGAGSTSRGASFSRHQLTKSIFFKLSTRLALGLFLLGLDQKTRLHNVYKGIVPVIIGVHIDFLHFLYPVTETYNFWTNNTVCLLCLRASNHALLEFSSIH